MAEERIRDKVLWRRLGSIKRGKEWIVVAERLGLRVTIGGKHPNTIRDPEDFDDSSPKNLIATIQSNLHKKANELIFKEILISPISARLKIEEDDIWKALGWKK